MLDLADVVVLTIVVSAVIAYFVEKAYNAIVKKAKELSRERKEFKQMEVTRYEEFRAKKCVVKNR